MTRRTVVGGGLAAIGAVAVTQAGIAAPNRRSIMAQHFQRERFVEDCLAAAKDGDSQAAVKEVLARAVRDHSAVLSGLGEPTEAGLDVLHHSPQLTIFAAKWTPQMNLLPHDHGMWALIGIYTGREDNILWRREAAGLKAHSANVLFAGDVAELPADAVHSVTNPLERFTGGIHIYGGDFFAAERSQWDPETLREQPSDGATIRAMFDRENARRAKICATA